LRALEKLGGSATIHEIEEEVIHILNIPDEIADIPHGEENKNRTELGYRLAWARTYLKNAGLIYNSNRGIWALISKDLDPDSVIPKELVKKVHANFKKRKRKRSKTQQLELLEEDIRKDTDWKEELEGELRGLAPDAFERLAQRLLRESGFIQVEVTGRSGDGGIDGKGILKVGGMISFHVMFQCKRLQGSVSSGNIRDFRGAIQGRADKGIFITTGVFTRDAEKEATRDGAPPIDLIDGEQLIQKLVELELGCKKVPSYVIEIDKNWFKNI
jgi:restriction system protein